MFLNISIIEATMCLSLEVIAYLDALTYQHWAYLEKLCFACFFGDFLVHFEYFVFCIFIFQGKTLYIYFGSFIGVIDYSLIFEC